MHRFVDSQGGKHSCIEALRHDLRSRFRLDDRSGAQVCFGLDLREPPVARADRIAWLIVKYANDRQVWRHEVNHQVGVGWVWFLVAELDLRRKGGLGPWR